jgi:hypothetical protein
MSSRITTSSSNLPPTPTVRSQGPLVVLTQDDEADIVAYLKLLK